MSPPIPRPPGPAIEDPGAHPQSPEAGEPCVSPTSMDPDDFWDGVRQTVYREILRAKYGSQDLDRHAVSALGVTLTDNFIDAMRTGKMVPGLSEITDARGECSMDWIRFACFARYYVLLEGSRRDHLREMIREGATLTEIETDEILGENWNFCTGDETDDDTKKWCCPDDVVTDTFYADLARGSSPTIQPPALVEDKPSWGKIAAISLGIVAVAVTLAYITHVTHPEAARARANPRPEPIRNKSLASKARSLRMETAAEHSFETWDETFEHLLDRSSSAATSEVAFAVEDVDRLVSRLAALGVKTSAQSELHHMLSLSSEAAA